MSSRRSQGKLEQGRGGGCLNEIHECIVSCQGLPNLNSPAKPEEPREQDQKLNEKNSTLRILEKKTTIETNKEI